MVFFLCIAVVSVTTGCGGGTGTDDDVDTATYTAESDTLSDLMGRFLGYRVLNQLSTYKQMVDTSYSIEHFSEGLSATLDRRHPQEYVYGVSMGIKMSRDIMALENEGINLNRANILELVGKNITPTAEVIESDLQKTSNAFDNLATRAAALGPGNVSGQMIDSLENVYASLVGKMANSDIARYIETEQKEFDTMRFIAGIERIVSEKKPLEYIYGAFQSTSLEQQIGLTEKKGVNIKRDKLLESMREVLRLNAVDTAEFNKLSTELGSFLNRIYKESPEMDL